jgi:signal transduction histidine kinase
VAAGIAAISLDGGYGFSSVLLVVSAVAAALVLPISHTVVVVAVQTVAVGWSRYVWDHGPTDLLPLTEAAVFAGFQLFAVAMVEIAKREQRARAELTALNVELATAQSQLAESSRTAERLRIARDMHDVIGHHLTALAVNLEVASHLVDGPAREHVDRSRLLAKETLADVRDVVSRMRESSVDLETELRSRFSAVPGLAVHLSVDPTVRRGDPARDEALAGCAQEIVTNAVRHAGARNVWITVGQNPDGILVLGRDDGRGGQGAELGNGLRGMRERFEQLGGKVTFDSAGSGGFCVEARLPAS